MATEQNGTALSGGIQAELLDLQSKIKQLTDELTANTAPQPRDTALAITKATSMCLEVMDLTNELDAARKS